MMPKRKYNGVYKNENLNRVAFPMGGMGAGMICLEGSGALSHFSLENKPDVFNEPCLFSAVSIKGVKNGAKVLEGQVPGWKKYGLGGSAGGGYGRSWGLPRFRQASFSARFPFCQISLRDKTMPLAVKITGWSPFIPNDADNSSLPAAGLEYTFTNTSRRKLRAVYSFHANNFLVKPDHKTEVSRSANGLVLERHGTEKTPWNDVRFGASVIGLKARVDCAWFRGSWFDPLTMAWQNVEKGKVVENAPVTDEDDPSTGGSLYVPVDLPPGKEKTIRLSLTWYAPQTDLPAKPACDCAPGACDTHKPWYVARYQSIQAVTDYWANHYAELREKSQRFAKCFHNSSLPDEVIEAASANLAILKSPTVLRQADGRLWAWEGCRDGSGCCPGSCTHVWNYAQALPHLFPAMERTLRETEFEHSQDQHGHQNFRAALPIGPTGHGGHAAADGQLGGVMKLYRDWRICGDLQWLKRLWPKAKQSLAYCIQTWDPDRIGVLVEPHHNTYDIEFWGPDGMCTSFYLGALKAAALMAAALAEDPSEYDDLFCKGRKYMETRLWNGQYFIQKIQWKGLKAPDPTQFQTLVRQRSYSPEAKIVLQKEGPKYQYGKGCLSDGVLGAWMALVCGVGEILDTKKVTSHILAVHKHNLKKDLTDHANPQRPSYALGNEAGLLLCTWPLGGKLSLPFVYSDEVWTGIEYQVASHLMLEGKVKQGLEIVRACRDRYDGRVRNPFDEYECGHWYARAMASYGLLQGMTGARYDAVEKTLYLSPSVKGDFRGFLSTATGYGTVGLKKGKPFLNVVEGRIDVKEIKHEKLPE